MKKAADIAVQNSLTKVFFLEKKLLSSDQNELEMISVQLPRKNSMFVRSSDGSICELLQFNEKHRSWFLNNTVCCNGKIYFTSKIDPLFIFLQYVEEHCKTKAKPLDQIMESSAEIFIDTLKLQQMRMVADQKGPEDLKAFMFNEEKTLKWLKKKFELIQSSLRDQNIISSGVSSMNFVKSSIDAQSAMDEDAVAEAALGIISEYISLDFIEKLDEMYGISKKSLEPIAQKRKSEAAGEDSDRKKVKLEEQENHCEVASGNVFKKIEKVTTKSKALEKAAKGSKAINSFFAKK